MKRLFLVIEYIFISLLICCGSTSILRAQQLDDSLYENYINEDLTINDRVRSFEKYVQNNYLYDNPDSARILYEGLYEFCLEEGYNEGMANAVYFIGVTYSLNDNYEAAMANNQRLEELAIKYDLPKYQLRAYYLISINKRDQGQFHLAYEYLLKGINVARPYFEKEISDDDKDIIYTALLIYRQLLIVLVDLNELEIAQEYRKIIEEDILPKVDNPPTIHVFNYPFACLEKKSGNYDKAIELLNEKLKDKNGGSGYFRAQTMSLLAETYFENSQRDSAIHYYNKCLEFYIEKNSLINLNKNYLKFGDLYLQSNNLPKAFSLYEKAKVIALDNNFEEAYAQSILSLSKYYSKANDYRRAYVLQDSFGKLMKPLQSEQKKKLVSSLSNRLEYEVKLKEEEQKNELEIQKTNNYKRLLYSALFVVLILLFSFFTYFRLNKKLKIFQQKLIGQKDELIKNKAIIENQNALLKVNNSNLENFAYIAAHDIKAPINTISNYLRLIDDKYRKTMDTEDHQMVDFIINDAKKLNEMVDGLLGFSSLTAGLNEKRTIDLNELIDNIFMELSSVINRKNLRIIKNIGDLPLVISHYSLLHQLFQNLINNSIKFSKETENTITIQCDETQNGYLKFIVKDEGLGIPEYILPKVFNLFSKHHENKKIMTGSGIGLATCKRIVDYMGGKIKVQSIENVETVFTFTMKVRLHSKGTYDIQSIESAE